MKKTLTTAILVALGCVSASAQAEVRLNGFASIVAGTTMDEDKSDLGYNDNLSFKPESKYALQAFAGLGDGLSATAQIMSRGENDFAAEFEWAYLTYELSDNSQLSAGRMRVPFYRYSDFLDVGYAYPWLRPPTTVYSLPFSSFEGLSYINNHTIGMADSSVQIVFGNHAGTVNLAGENDIAIDALTGVNWTVNYDWLTTRVAYFVAETSIDLSADADFSSLIGGLASYGLTDQIDQLQVEEDSSAFFGLGVSIDYNDILFDAEVTEVDVEDSFVAKQSQYYVSLGYRLNDMWTVLATVEHKEDKFDASKFSQVPTTFTHPQFGTLPMSTDPTDPSAPLIRTLVDGALVSPEDERDITSITARYNLHPAAVLKLDYTRIDRGYRDAGVFSVGVDLGF